MKRLISWAIIIVSMCFLNVGCFSEDNYSQTKRFSSPEELISFLIIERTQKYTVYREDYGGAYFDDNGVLNIGVVGRSTELINAISLCDFDCVYKNYHFSYNYLQKILNAIEDIMIEFDIVAVGIDDELNLVFICLKNDSKYDSIISYLKDNNLYNPDAIDFDINPGNEIIYTTATICSE